MGPPITIAKKINTPMRYAMRRRMAHDMHLLYPELTLASKTFRLRLATSGVSKPMRTLTAYRVLQPFRRRVVYDDRTRFLTDWDHEYPLSDGKADLFMAGELLVVGTSED